LIDVIRASLQADNITGRQTAKLGLDRSISPEIERPRGRKAPFAPLELLLGSSLKCARGHPGFSTIAASVSSAAITSGRDQHHDDDGQAASLSEFGLPPRKIGVTPVTASCDGGHRFWLPRATSMGDGRELVAHWSREVLPLSRRLGVFPRSTLFSQHESSLDCGFVLPARAGVVAGGTMRMGADELSRPRSGPW